MSFRFLFFGFEMTEQKEFPWIKNYPEGVPATINPDIYSSLPDFEEKLLKSMATPRHSKISAALYVL